MLNKLNHMTNALPIEVWSKSKHVTCGYSTNPTMKKIAFLLMLDQLNCETHRYIITLKHLGIVLMLTRYWLNYEANRSISTVVFLAMLYQLNHDAIRDILNLTSWLRFPPGNSLTLEFWKKIEISSLYHHNSVLLLINYELNYEENPKIFTLISWHRFHGNALPSKLWTKWKHHHFNFVASFSC